MEEIVNNLIGKLEERSRELPDDEFILFQEIIYETSEFKIFMNSAKLDYKVFEIFINRLINSEFTDNIHDISLKDILINNLTIDLFRIYGESYMDYGNFDNFIHYLFNISKISTYKNFSIVSLFLCGFVKNSFTSHPNIDCLIERAIADGDIYFPEQFWSIFNMGHRKNDVLREMKISKLRKIKRDRDIEKEKRDAYNEMSNDRGYELNRDNKNRYRLKIFGDLFNSNLFIFAIGVFAYSGNEYCIHIIIAVFACIFLCYDLYEKMANKIKTD